MFRHFSAVQKFMFYKSRTKFSARRKSQFIRSVFISHRSNTLFPAHFMFQPSWVSTIKKVLVHVCMLTYYGLLIEFAFYALLMNSRIFRRINASIKISIALSLAANQCKWKWKQRWCCKLLSWLKRQAICESRSCLCDSSTMWKLFFYLLDAE